MKHNVMLTIASLLSILLFTFHLSDDIVRGFERGGFKNVSGVLTLAVWLYGFYVDELRTNRLRGMLNLL